MRANIKLMASAGVKLLMGLVLVGLLIFLPAGTLCFFNGWLLVAVLFGKLYPFPRQFFAW